MLNTDRKIATLFSIALYEFYLTHKKELPGLSEAAREISYAIDDMIKTTWKDRINNKGEKKMEFTSEELKQIILGVEQRIVYYEIYCSKIQIADEKGWSPVLEREIAHISAKIAELTRLRGRLYEYKFNKK